MKVCTDACLFGAWVADQLKSMAASKEASILDIGAGTGLLSLILAQQTCAEIDALEIDPAAAAQAAQNFAASPWAERLHCFQQDAREWQANHLYDSIISNPPFFEEDLRSPDHKRNMALHDASLLIQDLLRLSGQWIQPDGRLFLLVPQHRKEYLLESAGTKGWYLHALAEVKQTERHQFFRCMACFGRKPATGLTYSSLTIREGENYSAEMTRLLQPYYLNL